MPLEGFRILNWVSLTFGGLPAALIGGMGVAVLITGVVLMVIGAKQVPASWGLISAGGAMAVLTYFIVGAAIAATGSNFQGGEQVSGAAPRVVPIAVSVVTFGIAMFMGRSALRSWASEETGGKISAVVFVLFALSLIFVGVQVVRGSFGDIQHPPATEPAATDDTPEPEPVRRGFAAPRRR